MLESAQATVCCTLSHLFSRLLRVVLSSVLWNWFYRVFYFILIVRRPGCYLLYRPLFRPSIVFFAVPCSLQTVYCLLCCTVLSTDRLYGLLCWTECSVLSAAQSFRALVVYRPLTRHVLETSGALCDDYASGWWHHWPRQRSRVIATAELCHRVSSDIAWATQICMTC